MVRRSIAVFALAMLPALLFSYEGRGTAAAFLLGATVVPPLSPTTTTATHFSSRPWTDENTSRSRRRIISPSFRRRKSLWEASAAVTPEENGSLSSSEDSPTEPAASLSTSSTASPPSKSTTTIPATTSINSNDNADDVNNTNNQNKLRSNRPFVQPMPANLRRKVRAQRPPRGHVVPQQFRSTHKQTGGSQNPRLRPQGKARQAGLNNPSMLQISAGTAKGRRLDSPDVYLRPMMGKVREAVFSTLTSFGLYDGSSACRHLDIFAGSGSVGLESLSRGASHCTFVDLSADCCAAVARNVQWCQFSSDDDDNDRATILQADALDVLREPYQAGIPVGSSYQLITLCPPYEEVIYADLLEGVANSPIVTEDTIVMMEYPVELGCLPHVVGRQTDGGAMIGIRNRRYGRTVIAMYIVNPTGRLEAASSRPEEFVTIA